MWIDVEQGTPEWLAMRAGMVTGSRVACLKKGARGAYPAERDRYMNHIILGRWNGLNPETKVTPAMLYGTEQEPYARAEYEIQTGNMVDPGGFAVHDSIKDFGASPDGLVGDDGLIEIKVPEQDNHLSYIRKGVVPEEYKWQMCAELACTGRKWVDFISFNGTDRPCPKQHRLFVCRYHRDDAEIAKMEEEVRKFLAEVELELKRLETQDLTAILQYSVEQAKGAIV